MGMNISIAFIDRTFLLRALYVHVCESSAFVTDVLTESVSHSVCKSHVTGF